MARIANRRLNRVVALAWALEQVKAPSRDWTNDCQMFVRMALGNPGGAASAIGAWRIVAKADRVAITADKPAPLGVPVYLSGGKYGHAVLSAGEGWVVSTDIKRRGKPDLVLLADIPKRWPGYKVLGWAKTINGERVYGSEPK